LRPILLLRGFSSAAPTASQYLGSTYIKWRGPFSCYLAPSIAFPSPPDTFEH
jgi:hypothetical protein